MAAASIALAGVVAFRLLHRALALTLSVGRHVGGRYLRWFWALPTVTGKVFATVAEVLILEAAGQMLRLPDPARALIVDAALGFILTLFVTSVAVHGHRQRT